MSDRSFRLASLPSIAAVLQQPHFMKLDGRVSPERLAQLSREAVEYYRSRILEQNSAIPADKDQLLGLVTDHILHLVTLDQTPSLQPVINGTGIILHTGLGRAPMHASAVKAVERVATGYCNLEVDQETGNRGSRQQHVEQLLCSLTGAEAALVVNNNAAALVLALNTLAFGREVIISRGELVEIGGSFRIPEIIDRAGAIRVEVGTTNRTRLEDYITSINEQTAALLIVHTSNYRIIGFTQSVRIQELIALGRQHELPVLHDLGSGALIDLREVGLPFEPVVSDSIKTGVDLAMFSGDKLMGGPQCGILVGRRAIIGDLKRNPLTRAVRCDKMTLAALEATLKLYVTGIHGVRTLPIYQMATVSLRTLMTRGKKLLRMLDSAVTSQFHFEIENSEAAMGSGSLPIRTFPSRALTCSKGPLSPDAVARRMRGHTMPVWGYIQNDKFWLDLRTTQTADFPHIARAFRNLV